MSQVAKAIQSGQLNFAVAGGTANALTAAFSPAITSNALGLTVTVDISADNTGAATLDVGPGALPIVTRRGAAIKRGDLSMGSVYTFKCTGAAWQLTSIAYSEVPIVATADVTLYVRTDGNDGNNGSANTAASAFRTILAAVNYGITRYAFAGFTLNIQLGNAGTYASSGNLPIFAGSLKILGDTANQNNYIIQGVPAVGSQGYVAVSGGSVAISGVTINNSSASIPSLLARYGGAVSIDHVTLASTLSAFAHFAASSGGTLTIGAGCVLTGNAVTGFYAQAATIVLGANINVPGNLSMTSWAVATMNGNIVWSQSGWTFTGTGGSGGGSSGQRYTATLNGVINTIGGGPTAFPGNTDGATSGGGQYG
ncbi:hypothetical protein [Rhizobium sp. 11_C7_N12_5]|uniref:hypothetical protein n=1 Tax=Rhizobium sp. 11_C7_N12_5 TaxID=3240770 RepID=UPI003F1FCE07